MIIQAVVHRLNKLYYKDPKAIEALITTDVALEQIADLLLEDRYSMVDTSGFTVLDLFNACLAEENNDGIKRIIFDGSKFDIELVPTEVR